METVKKPKQRSQKEFARDVAKIVKDLNIVLAASSIASGFDFFDNKKFRENGFDKLLSKLCKSHKITEDHIRNVGGWKKGINTNSLED